jgi:hypothetical protein
MANCGGAIFLAATIYYPTTSANFTESMAMKDALENFQGGRTPTLVTKVKVL